METFTGKIRKPSKEEQRTARESYSALRGLIGQVKASITEIRIGKGKQPIQLPTMAMESLIQIMGAISEGKQVTIVSSEGVLTTQEAAELLGCSRPHLVKLLESGVIPFAKVGRHRRVNYEDIIQYQQQQKALREKLLIEIMKEDEASGLYDTPR